jgi:hypothetical protein
MKYTNREAEKMFQEFFNEVFPPVEFGCLTYDAADVLKSVDPIAYRQEFLNWLDSEEFDETDDGIEKRI